MLNAAASSLLGGSLVLLAYVLWRRGYRWTVLAVAYWAAYRLLFAFAIYEFETFGSSMFTREVRRWGWTETTVAAAALIFGVAKMWSAPPGAESIEYGERLVRNHLAQATVRDSAATERDVAATERDRAQTARDLEATERDRQTRRAGP